MNLVLIPGSLHFPDAPGWYADLAGQLPEMTVIRPQFPAPPNQTLNAWHREFNRLKVNPRETMLLCHSLGTRLGWEILATQPFAGAVMVAPPFNQEFALWNELFEGKINGGVEEFIATFFNREFDWQAIRRNTGARIKLLFSREDKLIPAAHHRLFYEALGVPLKITEDNGHFDNRKNFEAISAEIRQLHWQILEQDPEHIEAWHSAHKLY